MISTTMTALIIGNTFINATPILFAGLGGMISEKSGVTNIGLEGMMTIGALVAATVAFFSKNAWLGLLCGGLGGMLFALVHAIVSITFAGDQIISGIAINYLGPGISLFLARLFFDGATQTKPVSDSGKIPILFKGLLKDSPVLKNIFSQYATVYLSLLCVVLIYIFLYKTKWGLRIIAAGEHPKACDTLNINVILVRYLCVLFSGFMAGIGGASMSIAVVSAFSPTLIAGQGFIALVTVIFGKWTPQGVFLGALFFGFAQSIAVFLGATNIPMAGEFIAMIPYIATLLILIFFGGKSVAPKASGKPYIKENI